MPVGEVVFEACLIEVVAEDIVAEPVTEVETALKAVLAGFTELLLIALLVLETGIKVVDFVEAKIGLVVEVEGCGKFASHHLVPLSSATLTSSAVQAVFKHSSRESLTSCCFLQVQSIISSNARLLQPAFAVACSEQNI